MEELNQWGAEHRNKKKILNRNNNKKQTMKKHTTQFLLLLALSLSSFFNAQAAPGDTTWVQAHDGKWLDYFNNFDTTVNFPNGTTKYRKIIMVFTLGKYICPGAPKYCSDWDYTVQTYAMNKVGDTVELGRLITPYANSARMPATWSQPYYFDVTDFATVLRDSNKIRIHYSGYSGGFTANIKFAMIEGTPERDVLGVTKLWAGSWAFGNASNPIDAKVAAKTLTAPVGTKEAVYRLNITGHGSDANGCSEFCEKYYQVLKNGTLLKQKSIWRDNCGFNNFYPQNGTWIYNRGNWCPGDLVHTNFHPIPSVSSGSSFDLSMAFEPYISSGDGSYTIFGNVVFYGPMNKTIDASLDEIIAPTLNENYFRENARIGYTTVKIRNSGTAAINNIEFEYGVTGETLTKATWTGTLASLSDTVIDLPFAESLLKATGSNLPYQVSILKVNGAADVDVTNNKLTSTFSPVIALPSNAFINFYTNRSLNGMGMSESSWRIIDEKSGLVVKSRINNTPETVYRDTLNLPTGVYKLVVSDEGCDGLSWWANPSAGAGYIQVKPTPFTSYTLRGYFGGDFGCGFTQYFKVGTPTNIKNVAAADDFAVQAYPNPANTLLNVVIEGKQIHRGQLLVIDNIGRVVLVQDMHSNTSAVNTSSLANGVYTMKIFPNKNESQNIPYKLVIVK
jgi:hypothetical protein